MYKYRIRKQMDLGAVVRAAREQRGLTQAELAEELVVPRDYVLDLENAKPTLQMTRLFRTLGRLGVKMELEWGADEKP